MFTFFTRLMIALLLILLLGCGLWAGLIRGIQPAFPPILYGETSSLQLFTTQAGCDRFETICHRSSRILSGSLYSFPVGLWSPDGAFIAVHLSDGWFVYPKACLLVAQTCTPVQLPDAAGDVRLAWGPQGTLLAAYANTSVATLTLYTRGCWDHQTGCLQKSLMLSSASLLTEPTWSADGSRMAFADYLGTGLIWFDTACFDQPAGCETALRTVGVGASRISWPSLSQDGRYAILTMDTRGDNTNHQIFQVELESGAVRQITYRLGTASFPDWSDDGRYILFSGFSEANSGDLQIYLMDVERQLIVPIIHHQGRDAAFASWGVLR